MIEPAPAASIPDWFSPSRGRIVFSAVLAAVGFLLPQELPLEWYPLNDPSPGTVQIEITCASSVDGTTQIFYNNGPALQTIDIPMAKTAATYTYVFPLPDAPLTALRIDPFFHGPGEFTVARMRLIERHGTELVTFPISSVTPNNWIKSVEPVGTGWKVTAAADSADPYFLLTLPKPVIPAGMNTRNLQRCLLSTGYLAGMLWLILLIVLTIFHREPPMRRLIRPAAFLALLALMFAIVGNRGLIRASVQSARLASQLAQPATPQR
jgi:hypothetical protein